MNFKENNKAIFLQIADRMCDDILRGKLPEETRIPSVRAMAADVEVNANTVMRAYEYLAAEGIFYNKRGIGFFVSPDALSRITERRRTEFLNGELYDSFNQLNLLGISPDELKSMYQSYLNKK